MHHTRQKNLLRNERQYLPNNSFPYSTSICSFGLCQLSPFVQAVAMEVLVVVKELAAVAISKSSGGRI
jgi:hypothetical protein